MAFAFSYTHRLSVENVIQQLLYVFARNRIELEFFFEARDDRESETVKSMAS